MYISPKNVGSTMLKKDFFSYQKRMLAEVLGLVLLRMHEPAHASLGETVAVLMANLKGNQWYGMEFCSKNRKAHEKWGGYEWGM